MALPQLTLFLPDPPGAEALRRVLEAAPFAAVVIGSGGTGDDGLTRLAKPLVPVIQSTGAAALLLSPVDPRLVARIGADGAHFGADRADLADVVATLRPSRIAGIGALRAKHDAMAAGERDIDYVMFGEPRADGSLPDPARVLERAQWWAEIFTLPCVAYVRDADAVTELAATGADFLALGSWIFETADPAATVRAVVRQIQPANRPAQPAK